MNKIIQIELKIKKFWGNEKEKAEKARAEKTTPMNMISHWTYMYNQNIWVSSMEV